MGKIKKMCIFGLILVTLLPFVNADVVELCEDYAEMRCVDGNGWYFDSCGEPQFMHTECASNQVCTQGTCQFNGCVRYDAPDLEVGEMFCTESTYQQKTYPAVYECLGITGMQLVERCTLEDSYCEDGQCKIPVQQPQCTCEVSKPYVDNGDQANLNEINSKVQGLTTYVNSQYANLQTKIPDISEYEENQQQIIQIHNQMNTGWQTTLNSFVGRLDAVENSYGVFEQFMLDAVEFYSNHEHEAEEHEHDEYLTEEEIEEFGNGVIGIVQQVVGELLEEVGAVDEKANENSMDIHELVQRAWNIESDIERIFKNQQTYSDGFNALSSIVNQQGRDLELHNHELEEHSHELEEHSHPAELVNHTHEVGDHTHPEEYPNYFQYMDTRDKKDILCGYMMDNGQLTEHSALGVDCTSKYREYRGAVRQSGCRCK